MKTIRFILMLIILICSINNCHPIEVKKTRHKTFQTFINKFRDITLPLNYKKCNIKSQNMTELEAMKFLNLTKAELYPSIREVGEDGEVNYYKEENIPSCAFRYMINDSVYVLCVVSAILGSNENTIFTTLYTFSDNAKMINKMLTSKSYTEEDGRDAFNFVLLDKNHIRVYYYTLNKQNEKKDFSSKAYYVNYEISNDGKFIEKDKSEIIWLEKYPSFYDDYNPKSHDPMNAY